jgi:hypothetical protein
VNAPANDRLFDELLRPVLDDFCDTAKAYSHFPSESVDGPTQIGLLVRLSTLQEVGDRIARVLGVPEPLWEDMRVMAEIPW